ncbi:Hypothetical predicted protein [Olea europaea subsp. europaea]|uniref:FAS1 domain-containing protein n=1 Tax=Olea europaea subsp. europaea TaxID=158383 RepID=A0A8S0Q285_OLEEU|nr:Hypothetical predicted protein [Olea europaea subsp. europaea]
MEIHQYSCFKMVAYFLPLFCLLLSWSWGAAYSIPTPFAHISPPPSSAVLASEALRNRGYSLFASILHSLSTTSTNFSGTLLAPPDFAFSFATAKFLNNRSPPPRPSTFLLLYHTLKPPIVLTWLSLSSRPNGDELRTYYNNNCLFLFKNSYGGEISISSSSSDNLISAVKIRQPDLYVDDHLTVHGIDGVLDPTFATKCSFPDVDPMTRIHPSEVNRSFLDHAIRALRWRGFNVVATAMAIKRSELLSLSSVTVFAVSDKNFFSRSGGFHFDFRHHVVPKRQHFADLAKLPASGKDFDTLAPNKTVLVHSTDGTVTIDSIMVDGTEIYHNRWIVVVSIMMSLDDAVDNHPAVKPPIPSDFPVSGVLVPSLSPFSAEDPNTNMTRIPSPAPASISVEAPNSYMTGVPSPAPSSPANIPVGFTDVPFSKTPSPAPSDILFDDSTGAHFGTTPSPAPNLARGIEKEVPANGSLRSPGPAPGPWRDDSHCDINTFASLGVEGADLFCPVTKSRKLKELDGGDDDVARSQPSISEKESNKIKISENVNIADDLFYYI